MQKFALTSTQRLFFREHGYIAFNNVLPIARIQELRSCLKTTLANRLKITPEELPKASIQDLYTQGYDLWRDGKIVEKVLRSRTLLFIAAQLFDVDLLRAGFDQFFLPNAMLDVPIKQELSISDLSCIKPLVGGIIIALTTQSVPSPLPQKIGHLLFISQDFPLPWPQIFTVKEAELLLFTFAKKNPIYYLEMNDPNHLMPRKWGYNYGDLFESATHPVLWHQFS